MAIILLIVRLVLGLGLAAHGAQKLFGWFGGYGIKGTGGFFESIGFRPGALFALAAGLGEFVSGMLVALGLGGPVGPALAIVVMLVAILSVHFSHGFFSSNNGSELPLTYISGMLLLLFGGFGPYAIDSALGFVAWPESTAWIALGAAVLAALLNVAARRAAPKPTTAS